MMSGPMRWVDALRLPGRVLLIVNTDVSQRDEITRSVDALASSGGLGRVSAIAPAAIRGELIDRGLAAAALLPFEVEVGYFLQSDRALQWAVRQNAAFVVGTEPYALNNEEVKSDFEGRIAPMMGSASLIAHTLPADQVFVFTLDEVWRRSGRQDAIDAHRTRVATTVERLYQTWSGGAPESRSAATAAAERLLAPGALGTTAATAAALSTSRRLHSALQVDGGYPLPPVRVISDPPGRSPHAGWLGGRFDIVRRPAQLAAGARLRHAALMFRGRAEGPYSYLLMSRPVTLRAGEAAVAEGFVHRGGVTVGLVKDGAWAARVDVIDRGGFVAAAIAPESGSYALVIAHCLHGQDRRAAVAVRRFGFRRAD